MRKDINTTYEIEGFRSQASRHPVKQQNEVALASERSQKRQLWGGASTNRELSIHRGWIYPFNIHHVWEKVLFCLCCNVRFTHNASNTCKLLLLLLNNPWDLHAHWPRRAIVAQTSFGAGLNPNKQCLTLFYTDSMCISWFLFICLNGCKL